MCAQSFGLNFSLSQPCSVLKSRFSVSVSVFQSLCFSVSVSFSVSVFQSFSLAFSVCVSAVQSFNLCFQFFSPSVSSLVVLVHLSRSVLIVCEERESLCVVSVFQSSAAFFQSRS